MPGVLPDCNSLGASSLLGSCASSYGGRDMGFRGVHSMNVQSYLASVSTVALSGAAGVAGRANAAAPPPQAGPPPGHFAGRNRFLSCGKSRRVAHINKVPEFNTF